MSTAADVADASIVETLIPVASEDEPAIVENGNDEKIINNTANAANLTEQLANYVVPNGLTNEIVFVDTSVEDYQTILTGIDLNIQVVLLDSQQDGIEQIAAYLTQQQSVDAIHIISHGNQAELFLGTGVLSTESMRGEYADELAIINQALTAEADFLIYGCNFGEGKIGQEAAELLAELTGADIAASNDLTGSSALGGDWELEVQTGVIESKIVVSTLAQEAFAGVLDVTTGLVGHWTFDADATDSSGNNYDGTLSGNAVIDTTDSTDQVGEGKLSLDGTGDFVDLSAHASSFSGMTKGTVSAWVKFTNTTRGTIFDLNDGGNSNFAALFVNNGLLNWQVTVNGITRILEKSTVALNDGAWHHIALTTNGSGNQLYVDGIALTGSAVSYTNGNASSTQFFSNLLNVSGLQIGAYDNGLIGGEFTGLIDDVRVYDHALTTGEITTLATNYSLANSVPGGQTTNEDTTLTFNSANSNLISITDKSGENLVVTLSVDNGTTTLSGTTGLTFTAGDGTADTTMTFSGTVGNINAALDGLQYDPTADYNGSATLTLSTANSTLVSLEIDANLQARYTFEGNANDVAPGTAQNGTLTNGATIVTDGTRGQVLSLDGVNDYVKVTGLFGKPSNVTLAAWVNLTSAGSSGAMVISLGDSVSLVADSAGRLVGTYYAGGTWPPVQFTGTLAGAGWHHLAFTFNDTANVATLYLDGAAVATLSTTDSINYTLGTDTYIGKHANGNTNFNYAGKIDDARIYDRALSASEVAKLANDLALNDTDTVAITVNSVNDNPIISSNGGGNTANINVAENTTAVTTVTSTDIDGGTAVYSISGGADAAKFSINSATGNLVFLAAPDYETPADFNGDNVYEVIVLVSDGNGGTDTQTINVTVTDVANTLTVTTTTDNNDSGIVAGDGNYDIEWLNANLGADASISLREAIIAANNTTGMDTIDFNISDPLVSGAHTIDVLSALPDITDTIIIDGTSEPNYAGTPIIELNGIVAGAGIDGLRLVAGSNGSTVQGLVINRFGGDGLEVNYSDNNTIAGNYIGTDVTGLVDLGNGQNGIRVVSSTNALIGGGTISARNVIAGNTGAGIRDEGSFGTIIQGNYIGVNATGTGTIANSQGIQTWSGSSNGIIGGTGANEGNVIGGNTNQGILLYSASSYTVQGNYIGTDSTGTLDLGNLGNGIAISTLGTNHLIGGTGAGEGNVIAFNNLDGITVNGSTVTGNSILDNQIYSNTGLGIDLSGGTEDGFGVTTNDAGDADTGANDLQNYPVLSAAGTDGTTIAIAGSINSTAYTTLRLEFFSNSSGDSTGYGEGQTYLGYTTVFTDGSGNAQFVANFDKAVTAGQVISATATVMKAGGAYGSTSEFAANVTAASALIVDTTNDTVDGNTTSIANLLASKGSDGKISLREAIIATNNTAGQDTIFLSSGTYTLMIAGSGENAAATGDLDILQNLTLIGTGASSTIVNATGLNDRVFEVSGTGTSAYFSGITVTGGNISNGGGILANGSTSLTLWDSVIANNTTTSTTGGGLYTSGTTFLNNVTVSGNSGASGAGIYSNNTLVISNSTIAANTGSNQGAGIWSSGSNANLTLINTTISGNSNSGNGGGLYNGQAATLINVTIAGNTANQGGGIFRGAGNVTTTLLNTIVAGNTATGTNPNPDISGAVTSLGNNIIGNTTGNSGWVASDQQNVNPLLNTLANNGGATQTMSLQAGSLAINAGSATNAPVVDQRGYFRDASYDIGAYEYNGTSPIANTAPVNTVPGAQTVNEDTSLALTGISVNDVDGNLSTVQLAVTNGTLAATLSGAATISAGANGSKTLTLSGSQADINATLASLTYQGNLNFNGSDTLTITSTDANSATDVDTVAITVSSVNDAPVNTVPGTQATNEDTLLTFNAANGNLISIADDAGAALVVTLSVANGTVTLSGTAGLTFATGDGTADTSMSFSGTVENINAALDGLQYNPTPDYNGSDTLTITSYDQTLYSLDFDANLQGHYQFEAADPGNDSSPVGTNDGTVIGATPTVDSTRGDVLSFDGNDYVEIISSLGNPVDFTLAAWVDMDATQSGWPRIIEVEYVGSINFNASNNKLVGWYHDGTNWHAFEAIASLVGTGWHHVAFTWNEGTSTAALYLDGAELSTVTWTLNDPGSPTGVTRIGAHPNGGSTFKGLMDDTRIYNRALSADDINKLVTAPVTASDTDTVAITVNSVNDAPVNTVPGAQAVNENTALSISGISVADVDGNLSTVQLAVTSGTLNVTLSGAASISAGANNTNTLTLSGTQTDINATLASLSYQGNLNFVGSDTLTVTSTDANSATDVDTVGITVNNVNASPVNTVPGAQTVNEDTALGIAGISVADADDNLSTVQLSVTSGTLNVTLSGAASISAGANNSNTLTLSGSLTDINATLASLSYQGGLNFNGNDTLTMISTDADSATDTDTVAITVNSVNDAPVNTVPGAQAVNENTALSISGISVADVDGNLSTVQLAVTSGTLNVTLSGAASISAGANNTNTLTLSGTQTDINATLASLSYQGNLNFVGSDTLTVTSTDANSATDVDTVGITVNNVNASPVNTVPGAQTVNEDTALGIAGISVADADDNLSTVQLSVTSGTLNVTLSGAASISAGANNSNTLTLSGSLTDINATLASLSYQGGLNFNGNDTLTMISTDADSATDTDTVAITVNSVNDAPVNTVPGAQAVNENTALSISGISVADVDGNLSTVQLAVTSGTLNVTLSGAASISAGANNTNTLTLSGTQTDINATLASLSYQGNLNFVGSDTLTVTSTDANSATDVDTVGITVNNVNASPVNTVPGAQTVNEDTALGIAGISVADADDNLSTVQLSVTSGTLNVTLSGAASISAGANNSNTLTLSGSLTDINATLASLSYQGGLNFNGNDTLTMISTDADSATDTDTVAITVNSVNDAPVNTVPGAQAVNENTALSISGISVADVDGNLSTVQLAVTSGTLNVTLSGAASISAGANNTNTLTLSGTQTDINATLASLSYQGNLNFVGSDTLTVTSTDANSATDVDTVGITVNNVNASPVNTVPGAQTVNEDTALGIAGISVADADDNLSTVQLSVTSGTLNVTLSGAASISAGANNSNTLTLSGSLTDINATLASLSYQGGLNFNGNDTLTMISTDADSATDTDTVAITVNSVNDAPVNTVPGAQAVNENTALSISGISVADVDGNLSTVQLAVTSGTLNVTLSGAASISAGANNTNTLTLSGTQTDINATLASLSYQGNLNFVGSDTLTVTSTDANSATDVDTVGITVNNVNASPVNTVPGAQTVNEDTALGIAGISVADADDNLSTVQLSVTSGTLNVTLSGAASISAGANNSNTLTLSGSLTDINATLASLSYQGGLNFNGNDTLTMISTDADSATDTDTVAITVNSVNDAPVNTVPGAQAVNENTALSISGISVADVDGNLSTVQLAVTSGTLNVTLSGAASISAGANNTNTLTLSGTQTDINATLASLSYQGNLNFVGSDTLTVTSTDANSATDVDTVGITVNNVNASPVNTVPGAQTVNEDTALGIAGISVADADDNLSTVQLSVTSGTLNVTLSGAASISAGANNSNTLTLSGSLTDINATLASLSYQGGLNFNGNDTLTMISTDADSATDTDTVAITVNSVNDAPVIDLDADDSSGASSADFLITFTENGGAVSLADVIDASLIDVDGGNLVGLTVTLSNPLDGTSELLTADTSGTSIVAVYDSGTGVLTLSNSDSIANYQQVLRTIQYNNTSEVPDLTNRVLYVVAEDGTEYSNTATVTVSMVGVNDAPINTVPGAQTVNEDTSLAIAGISVADADDNLSTIQLSVTSGTLNVTLSGAASISAGANNSNTLTLSGSLTDINATLASLSYQGGLNFNGNDTLTMISTDADSATDTDTVAITVNSVNDAPVNTVPGAQAVNENTALNISGISVADVDGNLSTVQLAVTSGTLNVTLSGAASISAGANNSSTLTLSGTQTDINATLASLSYQGNLNFVGSDTLTVTSTDANSATDVDFVTISVIKTASEPVPTTDPNPATDLDPTEEPDPTPEPDSDPDPGSDNPEIVPDPTPDTDPTINPEPTPDSDQNPDVDITTGPGQSATLVPAPIPESGSTAKTTTNTSVTVSTFEFTPVDSPTQTQPTQPVTFESLIPAGDQKTQPIDSSANEVTKSVNSDSERPMKITIVINQRLADDLSNLFPDKEINSIPGGEHFRLSLTAQEYESIKNNQTLWKKIELMQADLQKTFDSDAAANTFVANLAIGTGVSLSVGFVAWLMRAGAFLSSFLSILPAWKSIDPLSILIANNTAQGVDHPADKEALDSLPDQTAEELFEKKDADKPNQSK
ncbi:MAG: tandem-95 repeat protein [Pseudomonadales bacterium]|nr:tandem-95 repeat protein [Pseudomonadales bacterium]